MLPEPAVVIVAYGAVVTLAEADGVGDAETTEELDVVPGTGKVLFGL